MTRPEPAAALLADCWRDGRQIAALSPEDRPQTLADGYAMQDAFVQKVGQPVAGWKLGVGSRAGMRAGGLEHPLAGRVLAHRVFRNGDRVRLPHAAAVTVEFEIAFVLGRDIAPGDTPGDSLSAVERMHTTFELVLSRFVDRRAVGWPSFVGDNVGFEALVVGDTIDDIEAVAGSVVVEVDGKEMARGLTGDDAVYPLSAFGHLIDHARSRGLTLKRGEIATLGAVAKPFDLAHGARIVARYLGSTLAVTTQVA